MVTRWQPLGASWNELNRLHEEMNRLFDRWGRGVAPAAAPRTLYPQLNLWEDDQCLYVEAELPGLALNELEIFVTGENQLSLKGERRPPELQGGAWHRRERGFLSFSRLVELPCAVQGEAVTAEFKHGVLTIKLPKREEVRPRRIDVKSS
jgi:HSP20 family protein